MLQGFGIWGQAGFASSTVAWAFSSHFEPTCYLHRALGSTGVGLGEYRTTARSRNPITGCCSDHLNLRIQTYEWSSLDETGSWNSGILDKPEDLPAQILQPPSNSITGGAVLPFCNTWSSTETPNALQRRSFKGFHLRLASKVFSLPALEEAKCLKPSPPACPDTMNTWSTVPACQRQTLKASSLKANLKLQARKPSAPRSRTSLYNNHKVPKGA